MNSVSLIKALLINAACQNATAVCANTAGTEPADLTVDGNFGKRPSKASDKFVCQ